MLSPLEPESTTWRTMRSIGYFEIDVNRLTRPATFSSYVYTHKFMIMMMMVIMMMMIMMMMIIIMMIMMMMIMMIIMIKMTMMIMITVSILIDYLFCLTTRANENPNTFKFKH
jgi:hypothetical protein